VRVATPVNLCGISKVRSTHIIESTLISQSDNFLRFYCRIRYTKSVGLDDYSIGVALSVAIILGVMNGFHISYGAG
jgi:hypothetical protein